MVMSVSVPGVIIAPGIAPPRTAVLDFTGDTLSSKSMQEGGWSPKAVTVSSFKDLFTGSSKKGYLDVNGDGGVNSADYYAARDQILANVRQDFAAYDLNIMLGEQNDYQSMLTDSRSGDVLVMITGGRDFLTGENSRGVAPWSDLGNESDEIVWAFGRAIADSYNNVAAFLNAISRTVSHEMGHAFGLGHAIIDPTGQSDPIRHHIMSYNNRDFARDFNFQDRLYETDLFEYRVQYSSKNPQFNNNKYQNAHQYLSHPDVLGPSLKYWAAVLKPGELTVSGNAADNSIFVSTALDSGFYVNVDNSTFYVVNKHQGGLGELNPFSTSISVIRINGGKGDDVVLVNNTVTTRAIVHGNEGDDTLIGGSGADALYGDEGADTLEGRGGDDVLLGGDGGDTYRFVAYALGHDTIIDFSTGNKLDFTGFDRSVNVDLARTTKQTVNSGDLYLTLHSETTIQHVTGSRFADEIRGNALDNVIFGRAGDDEIWGRNGSDWLFGEAGDDVIHGGDDDDFLFGGSGSDELNGNAGSDYKNYG